MLLRYLHTGTYIFVKVLPQHAERISLPVLLFFFASLAFMYLVFLVSLYLGMLSASIGIEFGWE